MDYVVRGIALPAEFRAATTTTDAGALIPPTTLNRVIEKLRTYGNILPLVTRTAYKSGLAIPTSEVKPVATWVAEGATSDKQKKTLGTVTFSHFKLRCAVAVTLESEYMTLSAFEDTIVSNITELWPLRWKKLLSRHWFWPADRHHQRPYQGLYSQRYQAGP